MGYGVSSNNSFPYDFSSRQEAAGSQRPSPREWYDPSTGIGRGLPLRLKNSRCRDSACAAPLAGGVTTSMQGYADLERRACAIEHVAVVAPPALVAALATESLKYGLIAKDGNVIVPPARQYKDAEFRQLLAIRGVDGVLVVERDK